MGLAADAYIDSGEMLLRDSESLRDKERYSATFAIAVLAQRALPWSAGVHRLLKALTAILGRRSHETELLAERRAAIGDGKGHAGNGSCSPPRGMEDVLRRIARRVAASNGNSRRRLP